MVYPDRKLILLLAIIETIKNGIILVIALTLVGVDEVRDAAKTAYVVTLRHLGRRKRARFAKVKNCLARLDLCIRWKTRHQNRTIAKVKRKLNAFVWQNLNRSNRKRLVKIHRKMRELKGKRK